MARATPRYATRTTRMPSGFRKTPMAMASSTTYACTPLGFENRVRAALDRMTRLWVRTGVPGEGADSEGGGRREWRLALEGFGTCEEFAQGCRASALFLRACVAERHPLSAHRPSEPTRDVQQMRRMLE